MNLEVLDFLLINEHYIEEKANEANLDSNVSIVIAKLLAANNGELSTLKGKQTYHYDKVFKPLMEQVPCCGAIGMIEDEDGNFVDTCTSGGVIDDDSLFQSYQEEDFKCQNCRYDAEQMR